MIHVQYVCMHQYVTRVHDMFEDSETVMRCMLGVTDEFKVGVGLHQGLGLMSPRL